jgi:protein-S-isoprenylcysteine O-methyltransferase Ste14
MNNEPQHHPTPKAERIDYIPLMATFIAISVWLVSILNFIFFRNGGEYLTSTSVLGIVLLIFGLGIYVGGLLTLGEYYSSKVRFLPNHKLLTTGIYKYIRHPLYLGQIFFTISIPLILGSLYGFLIALLLIPLFLYRIGIEERAMAYKFGKDYVMYIQGTKKFIPYIY